MSDPVPPQSTEQSPEASPDPAARASNERALAERLAGSHVGLRPDLQVTRHTFRGEVSYLIRDPMTMQSHRFSVDDYQVVVSIRVERSLGEVFGRLVDEGRLERDDEERFYQFVLELHQLAFLQLPISDEKRLYRRFEARRAAGRRQALRSVLFLRVPLWNPDAFLDRTVGVMGFLFGRSFFAFWCLAALASSVLVLQNWQEIVTPGHGVLDAGNLPLLWLSLIGLKLVHELGHAYACKVHGGAVSEMGAFFVVFTPLAYVDATSSWGFPRRRDRLVVSLAGMYVESIVAMIALVVWATTTSSIVRQLAHNVMLLATVVTVVTTLNPLMRFDGYYVLSDWLEIPNLRPRASQSLRDALKQALFGIRPTGEPVSRRMRTFLVGFGLASEIYRVVLVLSISLLLATKAFLVGMAIAVGYVGSTLWKGLRDLFHYLWRSPETAAHRGRAAAITFALAVVVPLAIVVIPVPSGVFVMGQVAREHEHHVRAEAPGFLVAASVAAGDRIEAGTVLVRLSNDEVREAAEVAAARAEEAELRVNEARDDPGAMRARRELARVEQRTAAARRRELEALEVRATRDGVVLAAPSRRDEGRFLALGEPLATLGSGGYEMRALLTAHDLASVRPEVGQDVSVRLAFDPSLTIPGVVRRVAAAGSREIEVESLSQEAGGPIPVDPEQGAADQPYFEVTVALDVGDRTLPVGARGGVRLGGHSETLGRALWHRVLRMVHRISQG